jgi:hypothetical protein
MASPLMMLFLLPLLTLSSVVAKPTPCASLVARRQSYVGFNFKNSTNSSSGSFTNLTRNYNSLYTQLVQYDTGLYGHYVSFSESNENQYYYNGSLVSVKYSSLNCDSVSYKPKNLSMLWVKSFDGSGPFDWGVGQTNSTFTGSVTLTCTTPYCYYYDFTTGYSYDCSNATSGNSTSGNSSIVASPPKLQVKFNFTLYANDTEYVYAYSCSSLFYAKNSTVECAYPASYAYFVHDVVLSSKLNSLKLTPSNSSNFAPKVTPSTLDSSYSSYTENAQYFSVCGEGCAVIPVSK